MKIRTKLMGTMAIIFLLFGAMQFYLDFSLSKNIQELNKMKAKSLQTALLSDNTKLDIVQVQQFLTDISATRGKDGLDEGFTLAEEHAQSFNKNIDQLIKVNPDHKQKLEAIRQSFVDYYKMGKILANDYITSGPSLGNKTMKEFDGYATKLNNQFDDYRKNAINDIQTMTSQIENSMTSLKELMKTVYFIVLIMAIAIVIKMSLSIVRPINDLVKNAETIASGDLSNEIIPMSKDETKTLTVSFDSMRNSLVTLLMKLKIISEHLQTNSEQLNTAVSHSNETSRQISLTMNEMAQGSAEQADRADDILRLMEGTKRELETGAKQAEITVKLAEDSTKTAIEGEQSVNEAISHLSTVTRTVTYATESIQNLGKRSEEIGGIITTITNISEQTNLLALNAAIEAARAGENGRGFSIVAEEVRKLAEQSRTSSEQITNLIHHIQAETAVTVNTMESNLKAVQKQVEIIRKGGIALQEIVMQVTETENGVQAMKEIFDHIKTNTGEVLHSIQDISSIIEQAAAGTEEVAASTVDQANSLQAVQDNSSELLDIATELNKEIQAFKLP